MPPPETALQTIRAIAAGTVQNLKLLSRGRHISKVFSIMGSIQLPKPPIAVGITKKKIMKMACAVTKTL